MDHDARRWRVFVFAERGLVARLLGRDNGAEAVRQLFGEVERILASAPSITGLTRQ